MKKKKKKRNQLVSKSNSLVQDHTQKIFTFFFLYKKVFGKGRGKKLSGPSVKRRNGREAGNKGPQKTSVNWKLTGKARIF